MNNINICGCNYETNHIINVKENSKLEFNDGIIEKNFGENSIIHVDDNSTLNLNRIIFKENILFAKNSVPTCICSDSGGTININGCEFLNHLCTEYPKSAFLIHSKGDLSIKSSKFYESSKLKNVAFSSIEVNICYNN